MGTQTEIKQESKKQNIISEINIRYARTGYDSPLRYDFLRDFVRRLYVTIFLGDFMVPY